MSTENMTCGRARRLLWPDGGPRAATGEVIEAQAHVVGCGSCRQFLSEMRTFGEAIRTAAPREQAPAAVRRRVFSAVARARAGVPAVRGRRWRPSWLAAAAVLLVGVGGALTADRLARQERDDPISAIAEDHARVLGGARIDSTDPAVVAQWLAGQVHFAIHVPVLPDARLLGARLCVMDGRRGAVVEYQVGEARLSYFVVPEGAERAEAGEALQFRRAARAGYQLVWWREAGLVHAMVGSLPQSTLLALAKACVEQGRRAVAWLRGRASGGEG